MNRFASKLIPARCRRPPDGDGDIHVLGLAKGSERYIFLYDDDHRDETLRTIRRFAGNSELSLTEYDAANLRQAIRETA